MVGFLINTKSFVSLTPKRLKKIEQNGFTIAEMVMMNMNYWYGTYMFVIFKKNQTKNIYHEMIKPGDAVCRIFSESKPISTGDPFLN